jgi:hypothetical protein
VVAAPDDHAVVDGVIVFAVLVLLGIGQEESHGQTNAFMPKLMGCLAVM